MNKLSADQSTLHGATGEARHVVEQHVIRHIVQRPRRPGAEPYFGISNCWGI